MTARHDDPGDARELLGAYALDALEAEERAQVDELLLADPSARAELHELEQGAAWLGHASLRPPARAWDAIAAEVERDLAADRATDVVPHRSPRRPTSRARRWLVAAAIAVVVAVGAAGAVTAIDRDSGPASVESRYAAARRDPAARAVTLRTDEGAPVARAVVLPDRTAFMDGRELSPAAGDRDFQLWAITPDGPVSAAVMHDPGGVHRFRIAPGATGLAVTNEPRGGSREPTTIPIFTGDLAAA
jgi:anti-sigma-K factor RskA